MTFDNAFNLALRYLARSPKSVMEIKKYLAGKNLEQDKIDTVIDRLKDLRYLDDSAFARQFIENRIRFKPKSVYALGYELRHKGIDQDIADELLNPLDDMELAWSAARKKQGQWQHLDLDIRKKKLMNHLRYRGFNHSVCMTVLERFLTEC